LPALRNKTEAFFSSALTMTRPWDELTVGERGQRVKVRGFDEAWELVRHSVTHEPEFPLWSPASRGDPQYSLVLRRRPSGSEQDLR
jgi:hypothetical protein